MEQNCSLLQKIRLFVLDLDGTVYLGDRLLEGAADFIASAKEKGRRILFFTNNTSRSPLEYVERLTRMGIPVTRADILTAGDVTLHYLQTHCAGQSVYLLGVPALRQSFLEAGIPLTEEQPDLVVVGFDKALTYERLEKAAPDPEMFKIFRYKYDGHNLKTIIKAQSCGNSTEGLLSPLGTVDEKTLLQGLRDGDFGELEPRIAQAALQARETLAKTNDPQMVDIIIDRAVLESMSALAGQYKSKFLTRLVNANIDIANIRSFVRIKRIGKDLRFLKEVLADGGSIAVPRYLELFPKTFDDFFEMLDGTPYGPALSGAYDAIKNHGTLSEFEKLCDNFMVEVLKESRFIPFGIEPVLSYLLAKENEVQAIRIVMASKIAGVDPDKITERLRETYA